VEKNYQLITWGTMKTEVEEIQIKSGDLNLYGKLYLVNKNKPTIILLHGLGFHSFEYDTFAPLLVKEGYNCLSFDFRCCGKSDGKRGFWTLDDYVEDAANVLRWVEENINNKIVIYGNSLGGNVAVSLAAEDLTKIIKGIVAANCATRPVDFGMNPFRKVLLVISAIIFKIFPFRISVNYFIPYTKILTDKEIIKKIAADKSVSEARKFAISTYQDMFSWDMTKVVPRVKIPILVLQGKDDGLQSTTQSTMLFDAANEPKRLIITESGHLPNLENPEYLKGILISWLKKLPL
jgi:pimeloyl-ACP methyl ester carboxylesterase